MIVSNRSQDIRITSAIIENLAIKVRLFSSSLHQNLIETVTFVILVAKKSAFNPPLVYIHTFYDSYCFDCPTNFTIVPNGIRAEECFYVAGNFQASAPWFNPLGAVMTSMNQSTISFYTNAMSWSEFNISCYMNCGEGYHTFQNGTNAECLACPANCSTCTDQNTCIACSSGYFNASGVCEACSTGCTTCTSNNTCTVCQDQYRLSGGICL